MNIHQKINSKVKITTGQFFKVRIFCEWYTVNLNEYLERSGRLQFHKAINQKIGRAGIPEISIDEVVLYKKRRKFEIRQYRLIYPKLKQQ